MSQNFRIALRFLTAKRRAMAMSLSCIVLGVGLFAITQATTSGFEDLFVRTILGTKGAIRIEDRMQRTMRSIFAGELGGLFEVETKDGQRYIEGIEEPDALMVLLKDFPNVAGASQVLHGSVTMRSAFKSESVRAYGIEIDNHLKVSDLSGQLVEGSIAAFRGTPSGAIIGKLTATRMQLELGDSFELLSDGQTRRYRVAAIYETGVSEIDRSWVYLPLREVRSLLKKRTGASFIQLSLHDKDRAPADAAHMQAVMKHKVESWQARERTWLDVFKALRISSAITVSVFTLIAGVAMFNTLAMIVMEKTKEIAILRSMGYTQADVSRIFLWQAAIVLALGAALGVGLGVSGTWIISQLPLKITGIFKTTNYIVVWSVWHYVAAVLTAVTMVMIASLIPSRRAARLEPGDVIRGTGQ